MNSSKHDRATLNEITPFYQEMVVKMTDHLHLAKEYEIFSKNNNASQTIDVYIIKFDEETHEKYTKMSKETTMNKYGEMDAFFMRNEKSMIMIWALSFAICHFRFWLKNNKFYVGKGSTRWSNNRSMIGKNFDLVDPECFEKAKKWLSTKSKGWDPKKYARIT